MKIKLLSEWKNGETTYAVNRYQVLEVNDDIGAQLVKDGTAEEYKPQEADVKIVKDVPTPEEIQAKIDAAVAEQLKVAPTRNRPPIEAEETKANENGGYDEFWQFARDIYKAGPQARGMTEKLHAWCKTAGHMQEGDDSQGGYLVPEEFRAQLLRTLIEASNIRGRATVVPMATNTIRIPCVNETTHSGSTHGGIILYRPAEAAQKSASKPAFGQVQLTLHKLTGLIYVSDELMEDSPISIQPLLNSMFSEAFAFQNDDDFVNGTGAGMPLGVLNAPCLIAQAKETAQPADTIVSANIDKMWSRLHPRSHANSVWMANIDTYPQLAALERAVGTGGSAAGLVQSMPNSPTLLLNGRPLILTEHCQTLGDQGDIMLCDWRQYLIGQKAGASSIAMASSIHLAFDYDETVFRFVMRYDGQPWPSAALTPRNSTITLSPFVTLAARA